jgi:hypothetical protein
VRGFALSSFSRCQNASTTITSHRIALPFMPTATPRLERRLHPGAAADLWRARLSATPSSARRGRRRAPRCVNGSACQTLGFSDAARRAGRHRVSLSHPYSKCTRCDPVGPRRHHRSWGGRRTRPHLDLHRPSRPSRCQTDPLPPDAVDCRCRRQASAGTPTSRCRSTLTALGLGP